MSGFNTLLNKKKKNDYKNIFFSFHFLPELTIQYLYIFLHFTLCSTQLIII